MSSCFDLIFNIIFSVITYYTDCIINSYKIHDFFTNLYNNMTALGGHIGRSEVKVKVKYLGTRTRPNILLLLTLAGPSPKLNLLELVLVSIITHNLKTIS